MQEIKNIKIEEVIPYVNNPRNNKKAIDKVASSIKEFGFKQPIVIDKENVIIVGHTRLEAAKKLGIKEVPCIIADDLSTAQIKAYRIADNKVGEEAEWDMDKLGIEFEELKEMDFDLELTGFNLEDIETGEEKEVVEDDFNAEEELESIEEPISKRGDIWLLGKHRLMCGDSTSKEDIKMLMNGDKANMLFTDPPYGYQYQSNMRTKSEKFEVLKNDDKILDFIPPIKEMVEGFIFVCTTWKVLDKWIPLFKDSFEFSNMVIWDKGGGGIGDLKKTFSTDYEVILVSHQGKELKGKRIGSVWHIPKDNANSYEHATQKPIKLAAMAIEETTQSNSIVLDVFGGSGTTLLASEQLNRICRMMELDEKYTDAIVKRYINLKESDEDVFLLREGKKIPYSELLE